ncbi:MAG: SDR family oxidoreductase [Ilumatobacter sp.]|uniref:SDR family oxidoreductase n=1 Tax=Ilumatobacter sp. TaxID=1967498 RepID=UPI003C73FB84
MSSDTNYRSAGSNDLDLASLFGLSGKTAVVTGGSRGIGYMIAAGLVTNGVDVFITARKAEACDAAAAELDAMSDTATCTSIPADMADAAGLASFVATLREHTDSIDILVNNAGAAWGAPLGEFPEEGFDKVMDINVKAPFMLTQELLPELERNASPEDPGRVIMIGSIDGIRVPMGDNYSYSASKAGIQMLARHLAGHLVDRNLTVNSIAPGPFESKMMAYMLADDDSRQMVEGNVPRGRIGSASDIAGAVIFLASRAGAFTTGAIVPVDGGISTVRLG